MKNFTILILIMLLGTPLLRAQQSPDDGEWSIVQTFDVPGKASGLAWDGTYIYYGIYGQNGDHFYRLDPQTGDVTLLFTHPEIGDSYGMTWDGEYLWTINQPSSSSDPSIATQLDLEGNTISTFELPDHYMSGIAYDNGAFWVCTYYSDPGMVYKIDDQGNVLESFSPPVADQIWDVCRQDDFLWFADYNADIVYKTDLTGALLEQHDAENMKPSGIVWDGEYLWYADGQLSSNSTIYKVDLGGSGTPEISVPVTSHDFGAVTIGDSAVWNVTVNNIGNADLEIVNVVVPNNVAIITYETFPQTIGPGGSTELELIYKPYAVSLLASNDVMIESGDPLNPEVALEVTGEAVLPGPVINIDDNTHDYGTTRQGSTSRWLLPVFNIGDENLEITNIQSDNDAFYADPFIEFPVVITPPLNSVLLNIWFSPPDGQTYDGTLTITSNDPENPTVEVTLSGEGHVQDYPIGDQLWHFNITGNYDNSPKAIGSLKDITGDGVNEVIVCSEDNYVRCLNGNSDGMADVLWEREIYSGNVYQKEALSFMPDINDDGFDEVVVGTTGGDRSVVCLSGKTGQELWKFHTTIWGDGGWVYETDATRDFTNDGVIDVLACAGGSSTGPGADRVFCLNGTDGSLEWDYYFAGPGFAVMAIDDVNSDGVPDVLAGASNADETEGKTVVVDGSGGYEIWTEPADGTSVWALAQLDDVNGDGVKDVVSGEFGSGIYKVYDAVNGDALSYGTIGGGFVIITDIITLDDVNGDGYADFTIQSSTSNSMVIDGKLGGNVWFTSLADQAQKVDRIADISGDNINDVVIGTLYQNNYVYYLDGTNGDILQSVEYGEPVDALSAIPDINGDVSWEVVAGGREGSVTCFSGGLNAYTAIAKRPAAKQGVEITASPNPFIDHCTITLSAGEATEGNLSIITAGGRLVKDFGRVSLDENPSVFNWNGSAAHSGFYFVVLSNDRHNKVMKLIKQ